MLGLLEGLKACIELIGLLLYFQNVLVEDSFVYTCSAGNKFGTDSASGHLIVRSNLFISISFKIIMIFVKWAYLVLQSLEVIFVL